MIIIILSSIIIFIIFNILLKKYHDINMKIIKLDEEDIQIQEINELDDYLSKSGEINILSKKDKELGESPQIINNINEL